jgi:MFS family permease
MIISEIIGLLAFGLWLTFDRFEVFALSYVLYGLVAATWGPAMLSLLARGVLEGQRAEEMGRLVAFQGLVRFPGPYLGGLLYNFGGFRAPLIANLLGIPIATLLIGWLAREPPAEHFGLAKEG